MVSTFAPGLTDPRIFHLADAHGPDTAPDTAFRERFDKSPFLFAHGLGHDPRFALPRLSALARRLPLKYYDTGDIPVNARWDGAAPRSCSFGEAVDTLPRSNSWIILKRVHEDAEYAPVLRQCLDEVQRLTGCNLKREVSSRTMSVILSSPGRVTPYHMDSDCNFLFQVQGEKTIYVFDANDRSVVTAPELERFWKGDDHAAPYRERTQDRSSAFGLQPNNGVHVPVAFPHWVRNGAGVSVSVSINFKFRKERYDVHRANHLLRKSGLRPRPVGCSPAGDRLKAGAYGAVRLTTDVLKQVLPGKGRKV
jgi:hypothetical protein